MSDGLLIDAAVFRGYGGPSSTEQLRLRACQPDEVLVRVMAAGVCHTDLRAIEAEAMPHARLPAVLGHEGAGTVEAVGADVHDLVPGDRVSLTYASCSACPACKRSAPASCEQFAALNFLVGAGAPESSPLSDADGQPVHRWFGQSSFASHAIVHERSAIKVPADVPWEVLAPLGCSMQTGAGTVLSALGVAAGTSVVVFGCGGVGLAAVMGARIAGAARILAVDMNRSRLDLALELGATEVLQPAGSDLADLRARPAFDHSVDTTGVDEVMVTAVEALRPGGSSGLIATAGARTPLFTPTSLSRRTVRGVAEGGVDPQQFIPELIDHWRAGRFPVERMVSSFSFSALDEAMAASRRGEVVKPVLRVGAA